MEFGWRRGSVASGGRGVGSGVSWTAADRLEGLLCCAWRTEQRLRIELVVMPCLWPRGRRGMAPWAGSSSLSPVDLACQVAWTVYVIVHWWWLLVYPDESLARLGRCR